MSSWVWYGNVLIRRAWDFVTHWFQIFLWAHVCMWEYVTGQEVSCPKCWKCTTARYILLVGYTVLAWYLLLIFVECLG